MIVILILTKFHKDRSKIVEFLFRAYFGASVIFFVTVSRSIWGNIWHQTRAFFSLLIWFEKIWTFFIEIKLWSIFPLNFIHKVKKSQWVFEIHFTFPWLIRGKMSNTYVKINNLVWTLRSHFITLFKRSM